MSIRSIACAVLGLCLLAGCARRPLERALSESPPPSHVAGEGREAYLEAHLLNGDVVVFSSWTTTPTEVDGFGVRLDLNREERARGTFTVPVDSVAIFETNRPPEGSNASAFAIMTGITGTIALLCAANPKACFGSCPTFYASDGERMVLQAEGFSGSIAPPLEATDVDALFLARPSGDTFTVRMTNEALETHVVRHADLLMVPRPDGGRAWHVGDDRFQTSGPVMAPLDCSSPDGDCLPTIGTFDGEEYFSLADSTDLGTTELLELTFDRMAGEPLGLVVGARQSLLTTFVFYQALAFMGEDVGDWFAMLQRRADEAEAKGEPFELGRGPMDPLIEIEVLAEQPDGSWAPVGLIREHGPLAMDVHLVPLDALPEGPVTLRLRLVKGAWRIDGVGLVALEDAHEPIRVQPSSVLREGAPDADALARVLDPEQTLVTGPGDAYTFVYPMPPAPDGYELFLESRGYYLEWMREAWMDERDPDRVAQMLFRPEEALRVLAPHFKALEPTMEAAFWQSRYVRP